MTVALMVMLGEVILDEVKVKDGTARSAAYVG